MLKQTFKRYELKYFVTPRQYETLSAVLKRYMTPDTYCAADGSYMIYNVYFDTDDDAVIRHSLSKPAFKEKLRMRSYAMPTCGEDTVFLELKKKINGIVAKRRATMTYSEAIAYIKRGEIPRAGKYEDYQVLSEIGNFLRIYNARPKVFISYERVAYFDAHDAEFRVSFDRNILTRRTEVDLSSGDYGRELVEDGRLLMEIKTSGGIPLWLARTLSELGIRQTSFSKYGTEYKRRRGETNSYGGAFFEKAANA